MRVGLDLVLDRPLPLAGAVVSARPLRARARARRGCASGSRCAGAAGSSSTGTAVSLVAGRAALVPGGADPQLAAEYAARAGATAVVVYGTQLPAGGLGLDESGRRARA